MLELLQGEKIMPQTPDNELDGKNTPDADMCEEEIDYNVMASFPASDPPSWTLGISPRKKFRSNFDSEERLTADEPTHQNEMID
jgi:hypothetical protein